MALPWEGMSHLAEGPIPPGDGDRWQIALARGEVIDQRASRWMTMWTPFPMGEGDLHASEDYPTVAFASSASP